MNLLTSLLGVIIRDGRLVVVTILLGFGLGIGLGLGLGLGFLCRASPLSEEFQSVDSSSFLVSGF